MAASLVARGLWLRYPGHGYVLRGAGLEAGSGEAVAVVGPTGSGKTSLLLALAGLLRPERGEVLLDGRPVGAWARRRIGLLFQSPDDQLFNPTVFDEIAYALRSLGLPEPEVGRRVRRVAEALGIGGLLGRQPYRLSVGQKKLVALASVLVYEPDVLLLDEPLANLDRRGAGVVREVVAGHRRRGGTVVLATHSVDTVLELSTKLCLLEDGVLRCLPTCRAVEQGVLEETSLVLPLSLRLLLEEEGWRGLARRLPGCGEERGSP